MSKSAFILLSLLFALTIHSLPATFDIRYQPHIAMYGNFDTSPDYICESYSWAKQLAQILGNRASVDLKQKIVLSGQQMAECVGAQNDKCKETTLKNIEDAIRYVQNEGLAEQDCYWNRFFELPSKYCARKCGNGESIVRKFKAIITEETDVSRLLEAIGNGQSFGFAVFKFFEKMNYYSPDSPQNLKNEGELLTYGIGEIVGWRKGGEEVNLRMGASGWGYKGYAFVPVKSPILTKFYSVKMLGYQDFPYVQQE